MGTSKHHQSIPRFRELTPKTIFFQAHHNFPKTEEAVQKLRGQNTRSGLTLNILGEISRKIGENLEKLVGQPPPLPPPSDAPIIILKLEPVFNIKHLHSKLDE